MAARAPGRALHWSVNVAFFFFTDPAMVQGGGVAGLLPVVLPPVVLAGGALVWLATRTATRTATRRATRA